MTDEPREENRPEEEDVEGHGALGNLEGPLDEKQKQAVDEDDDVEAHSPNIGPNPTIGPEPTIGP